LRFAPRARNHPREQYGAAVTRNPDLEPAPPALGDAEYRALADFREAVRQFLAFSDAGALEQRVTSQQHQALLAIRGQGENGVMSVGEIAERLGVQNHSAVGLVARMVERGLVARRVDGSDRRRVLVTLRPEGLAVLDRISSRNIGQHEAMARRLAEVRRRLRHLQPAPGRGG
jgi:DNA-binding MarR family transcriptional regulator